MNNLENLRPFKRLCMTIGNLPTAYIESMSYYECLTYLIKYLTNEVIPTVNNNSEVVKELQDYVATYFDNLDVQEEINTKLDEMATDGTLAEIINQEIFGELNDKIDLANSQLETLIENYNDIFADTSNKFVMIGDSIGEGYGWWNGNLANKNNSNDGFFAILRQQYPNSSFNNLSVSGSTIANITGYQNLQSQILNVPADTTHCFIITGINDVTVSCNTNTDYIGYPTDKVTSGNYISNQYATTCEAFESNIQALLSLNNNMKIYYLIEPTIDNANYNLYDMCFSYLKFICDKYGVNVIDFRQMFRKYLEPYSSQYFQSKVHPNENGYRLMYPYFRNHVISDINDNFKELPPCMITNNTLSFTQNHKNTDNGISAIAEDLAEKCPLWQQSFDTILLSSQNWGSSASSVANLKFTYNYSYGKIEIQSIYPNYLYNYVFYIHADKYSDTPFTTETLGLLEYTYYNEDITNKMQITNLTQLSKIGIYRIAYDKLEDITNLIDDLKTDTHGWAICEVLSDNDTWIIQRWTSLFKKDKIYIAYINNSTPSAPVVDWKSISTTTE